MKIYNTGYQRVWIFIGFLIFWKIFLDTLVRVFFLAIQLKLYTKINQYLKIHSQQKSGIWKKINHIEDIINIFCIIIRSGSYQQIGKNCSMNNQVTYYFYFAWIYWFFRIHRNFFNCFYIFDLFWILKNKRNVVNFRCDFVATFHITHNNISGYWTNSCTIIALIFFHKQCFRECKKKLKKFIWILKNQ